MSRDEQLFAPSGDIFFLHAEGTAGFIHIPGFALAGLVSGHVRRNERCVASSAQWCGRLAILDYKDGSLRPNQSVAMVYVSMVNAAFRVAVVSTLLAAMPGRLARASALFQSADSVSLEYGGTTQLTLHEPVIMNAIITNGLDQRLNVDLGKNYVGAFQLTLTRPDGSMRAVDPSRQRVPDEASVSGTHVIEPCQRYSQPILLNEWFDFSQTGAYYLTIRFRGSIMPEVGRVLVPSEESLQITVLPFNERTLRDRCEVLLRELQEGKDADDWIRATRALAAVNHPIAVTFLSRAIIIGNLTELIAIDGLTRIGTPEAEQALEEATLHPNAHSAEYARLVLTRLRASHK